MTESDLQLVRARVLVLAFGAMAACDGSPGSETIGPGGGELRLDGFIMTIPPDALVDPVTVTVTRTTEIPPSEYQALSAVYQIEPFDFEIGRKPARIAIQADGVEQAELMWTAADGQSYEPRLGYRGPDFVSADGWRFGRVFAGARRACERPDLEAHGVPTDPDVVVRGFGWSRSRDGLRQRLVVAEQDSSGLLQIEQFDANTLAFVQRTVTDLPISATVQPVVDRLEPAVYVGVAGGGVAIVGIDAAGASHVQQFLPRGELLRLEVRAHGDFTQVDALARAFGPTGRHTDDNLNIRHDDGVAELAFDGYTARSAEVESPVLDLHSSNWLCNQESYR